MSYLRRTTGGTAPLIFSIAAGFLAYSVMLLYVGYLGIALHMGQPWAAAGVLLAIAGLALPACIGAFYGAVDVFGYSRAAGLAFVMPAVAAWLVAFPTLVALTYQKLRSSPAT